MWRIPSLNSDPRLLNVREANVLYYCIIAGRSLFRILSVTVLSMKAAGNGSWLSLRECSKTQSNPEVQVTKN